MERLQLKGYSMAWLNDVFDIHRNEKTIKLIKGKTDDYDMELKQQADSLMQIKLK